MEIKAKVIKRMEAKGGTSAKGNAWKSQDYVIQHGSGQYPKHMVISFGPDPAKVEDAANKLKKGTVATFHFDIDANEYQDKWYNRITCWKIVLEGEESKKSSAPEPNQPSKASYTDFNPPTTQTPTDNTPVQIEGVGDGDLPF